MPTLTSAYADFFKMGPVAASEEHCFHQPGWHVWCGSIVTDDLGLYHLFYSRWPVSSGFDGWVTNSEIARAVSRSLDEPFEFAEVVFRRDLSERWDSDCFHNVTVKRFGSRYYMYYMGNYGDGDWWTHRNHQRIGVAVADEATGPWKRLPSPALDVTTRAWDSLMVSNPTVTDTPDGRYMMIYKGVGEGPMPRGGKVLHGVAWADRPDGPFAKHPLPIFTHQGERFPFEDPYLWREGENYFCLLKDMVGCMSSQKQGGLILMASRDGINWHPSSTKDILGKSLRFGDTVREFERLERPQLIVGNDPDECPCLLVAALPRGTDAIGCNIRVFFNQPAAVH